MRSPSVSSGLKTTSAASHIHSPQCPSPSLVPPFGHALINTTTKHACPQITPFRHSAPDVVRQTQKQNTPRNHSIAKRHHSFTNPPETLVLQNSAKKVLPPKAPQPPPVAAARPTPRCLPRPARPNGGHSPPAPPAPVPHGGPGPLSRPRAAPPPPEGVSPGQRQLRPPRSGRPAAASYPARAAPGPPARCWDL